MFALHSSIIYTLALQEVCFISGNETSMHYLNGWPVQFIWSDILYNLKEKKKARMGSLTFHQLGTEIFLSFLSGRMGDGTKYFKVECIKFG